MLGWIQGGGGGTGNLGQERGQIAFYWLQVCVGFSMYVISFNAPHLLVRWCDSPFTEVQGGHTAGQDRFMI